MKDFDTWNHLKKQLEMRQNPPFANPREIWWCHIGVNIGTEEDGKNDLFERPVLILHIINKSTVRVAPLSSKTLDNQHRIEIMYNTTTGSVILSQVKTISTKRLSRKLARIDKKQFNIVINQLKNLL